MTTVPQEEELLRELEDTPEYKSHIIESTEAEKRNLAELDREMEIAIDRMLEENIRSAQKELECFLDGIGMTDEKQQKSPKETDGNVVFGPLTEAETMAFGAGV